MFGLLLEYRRHVVGLASVAFATAILLLVAPGAEGSDIVAGKRLFTIHCTSCHGLNGTGGAGPNLTDQTSLHGNGYYDIFDIILNGVKGKPMEAWRDRLTVAEIEQITTYVFSLLASRPKTEESTNPLRYRM